MEFREASPEEYDEAVGLLRANEQPHEDIKSGAVTLFSAHEGRKRIGLVGVELHGRFCLLRSLVIEEGFRGKGFGKELARRAIDYAGRQGVEEVFLLTETADRYFEKMGFEMIEREEIPEEIKKTHEYKYACPRSATCMHKKL